MNQLRRLDDQLLLAINSFARHTPALHGPLLAYAKYGVALFGLLLLLALVGAATAPRARWPRLGGPPWPCS